MSSDIWHNVVECTVSNTIVESIRVEIAGVDWAGRLCKSPRRPKPKWSHRRLLLLFTVHRTLQRRNPRLYMLYNSSTVIRVLFYAL